MKIAVLGGGGAMGGLFGGMLAHAGNDVSLIDVSRPALDAINASGLAIEEKDGTVLTSQARATDDASTVGQVDLIVNFVKCYHTEAAIHAARPMIGSDTMVLSLQNGWGNAARIAGIIGEHALLVGLTYHSANLAKPGHINHPGVGVTHIGELDGTLSPRLERLAATFEDAGFEVAPSTRIVDEVWKKLALNVCTLPPAGLLRFHADELVEHDGTMALMRGLLDETVAVASAQGISLDGEERWAAITGLLARAIGAKASMLQDVEAERRTEIDVINGAIVAAGKVHGVATPLNDTMVWLIKSLEEAYLGKARQAK
ncbi:2-dehydropantoate 2-reductase [Devosia algicola]|uniref:2-dehydropantoate 2-reductase n=1 Tax=Devosia algicola TaxID=3026418 RepID=A0ABY7YQE9_9HYPH|nr:2-dehydropantoate 2-reductase [Devosia algicola]WDR03554.1 2-dehydropantoate 2-reductase [Devosia algicola]